jgi:hypothetical protein
MKQVIQLLSIIILIALVAYFSREFFPKVEQVETVRIDTIWKYKTLWKDTTITKLVPKYVYLPGDTIYIPIDNDELKSLYLTLHRLHFSTNRYEEVFPIDTIGEAKISASVHQNKLDTLSFSYSINLWEKEIRIIERVVPNDWYLYGETNFNSLSIGTIHTRQNFVYKATYNINEKSAQVGVGIKISKLWK